MLGTASGLLRSVSRTEAQPSEIEIKRVAAQPGSWELVDPVHNPAILIDDLR